MELKNKNDTLTQRLNQLNWYVEEQEGKKKLIPEAWSS